MSQDELDLIPTPELVDAIYRRQGPSGGVVLIYVSDLTDAKESFGLSYRGGITLAIGLTERAKVNLLEECHRAPAEFT